MAKLVASARETIALTQATPERRLELTHLLARWALVREQPGEVEARIAEWVDHCPEGKALLTVPESGGYAPTTSGK